MIDGFTILIIKRIGLTITLKTKRINLELKLTRNSFIESRKKIFCDPGKINFPTKRDLKIMCTLQTEMKKLIPLKNKVMVTDAPDVQILFARVAFIQYSQILLTKNLRQYLETIMLSSKVLCMGIQKTPYQKTYKLQVGSQNFEVDLKGWGKQFDWLEILLVYDKSDEHTTNYDSYNAEYVARMKKNIELSYISNDTQKHLIWKLLNAWHCDGYTKAPVSDYINNLVFHELLPENKYMSNTPDERIYIDLSDSLGYKN